MANDRKDNTGGKQERQPPFIPDQSVEQAKRAILYGIGYRNPPQHTRFKKGQSGNPNGRPKSSDARMSSRSANALFLKEAERLISVRQGGEVKQVTAMEAAVQALFAVGLKGSPFALKHLFENYREAECERQRQIEESNETWRDYVEKEWAAIAVAERNGEPAPNPLPHPDDVIIDHEHGVRINGPVCEEEARQTEDSCRMRDVLIMQDALDQREWDDPEEDDSPDRPGSALLFATILNRAVPDRFKLSEDEFTRKMNLYAGIPKRQLLKEVYRGWRSLGHNPPRGKLFPPLRVGKAKVELLFDLIQRWKDGSLDILDLTVEELADEIDAVIQERQLAMQ